MARNLSRITSPTTVAGLGRAELLEWMLVKQLLPALDAADAGSIAFNQLASKIIATHKELDLLRSAADAATATDFEQLSVDEQRQVIGDMFRGWPDDYLMLAISELQDRHPGRVRVLIEGQGGAA